MADLRSPDFEAWYATHCKPFKERYAANALAEQLGLTVYLPEIKRRFRGQIRYAPIFPCYLFVRVDLQAVTLNRINNTFGVVRLVTIDDIPQPVPTSVIDMLRQRVDHFNTHGGLLNHSFRPGDTVRLKEGPLQGLEAVFVGPMKPSERVHILIDFLGRHREAEVDVDTLERAAAAVPKRERRTRGKGRHIKLRDFGTTLHDGAN
jgi:transcription elongation factor/antiterminator RfaH